MLLDPPLPLTFDSTLYLSQLAEKLCKPGVVDVLRVHKHANFDPEIHAIIDQGVDGWIGSDESASHVVPYRSGEIPIGSAITPCNCSRTSRM